MVKVTFNNKPAQGKTAPVSPNKKTGGGVSIAFPNGIKKQGFIQTTPYQKALDEAILRASAAGQTQLPSDGKKPGAPMSQSEYQKALDEAMMKRAAADQKNKERGRKSYNRTHAQEVREITGDKTKKSITPIIKSAAAGYAADMVGAADTLLRAPSGLNYAASQERGEIEASKKNIAAYTERLKAAKTEEERQQWQTLIDRNKRLIEINSKAAGERVKNYQDATKGAQETLQGTYQKLRKTASDNMEKANEGLTPVGKYLNNVGVAGAQMVADATLGGGSALGSMFLRAFGGNSQEAAEAADKPGMSAAEQLDAQNRALLYGTASGAVSIATEKISNVAAPFKKAFGGGFLDKAIDGAIAKMNGNTAGRLALSFLSEGGEEVIEDIVQPALQTIYNGQSAGQNYSELDAAEILNDFLVGGTLGLLGGGVEGVQKMDARLAAERAAAETQEPTASVETTTPEATAPAAQRQAEPTVEQRPVQRQNTEPVPTPTVGQQNTMPAQPAVTPESAQGMGEGNLTPTQPNAAQGAAEGKADALDAGKRVNLLEYSNEQNAQKVEDGLKDGTLAVDAKGNIYRVNENQHIDRRDSASVGERSVNAFQFDHPELHSYYADAAAVLQEEMSFAQKGGELIRRTSREAGDDEYIRTKRGVSERIARLLDDEGVRYDDIDRSLSAIIHNHGQENFAAAKRVELLLDDMLTNGYTDIHGQHIAPNEEYIAAKKAIPGADMSERTHEELPIYDMPEGRNGGIDNAGQETRNDAAGAEFADAGERGTQGEDNAARALSDGAAERGERRGNGRESERIPREVRNVGGEDGNALTVQQRLAASGISQFISPREANVPNGASGDNTVTIFDEADWDQELIGAADWAKSKGVKKVTALLGVIKVEKDGKTGRIFGAFNADTGEIFVNAGSVQRSVSETIEHETAHYLAEVARRENVRTFMRDVQSRYSSEEWGKVYDAYFDRYAALTGDYAGMSESDIELYVWEEIMGDAYAEIDQYDEKASQFNREAESALSQSGQESESVLQSERTPGAVEQGRETAAATERRTGPPEKFSVLEEVEGENGTYGKGVMLDTNLFDGIRPRDWGKTLGRYVYNNMAGMELTAYDAAGKPETIYLARTNDRVQKDGAKNSRKVIDKLARSTGDNIRSLAVVHLDEALTTSRYENSTDEHNHQWMDENGWEYRKTYLQDRSGNIYEATLNIADGRDRKILYDINNIRLVDKAKSPGEHTAAGDSQRSRYQEPTAGDTQSEAKAGEITGGVVPSAVTGGARSTSRNFSEKRIADESENVKSPTPGDEIHRQIMGEENEPSQMPPGNRVLKSSELRAKAKLDDSSVSDDGGNVKPKTRYSVEDETDSAGRELTAQQREYFKDSKARDEQGRLLTLYHGTTAYGEFTKFRRGRSGWLGPGIYLTSDLSYAERYANSMGEGNGHLYKLYANAINPLVVHDGNPVPEILFAAYGRNSVYKNRSAKQSNDATIITTADIKKLREKGYDGIRWDFGKSTELSVFSPEQIKNVSNETPTDDPDIRFSVEDEDGGEPTERQEQSYEKAERDGKRGDYRSIPAEWKTKLERARTAATNNIKPSGFDSYDAYLDALDKQRAADRAERLRVKSRDEFKGTKALDELGVKIANSAGIYHNAEQLIANDKAAKSIQNATKRAEQRLGATRQEKTIARDIANGERSMADIPRSVKKSRVLELVDYYTAQKATKTGLLQQQRIEINDALREQARELIGTEAPEINRKGLNKLFDPSKGLVLYHRTPQRIMRALFGWKQGQQINEAVFEPVYENEQERKRFINRMFDEVRTFEGADGKKSALNKDESAFAQRLKEGRTVEELVEKSGAAESIRAAAENLKNGAEMKDAARDFSLDKGSRDLARQYADWLQTQDDYAAAKNVDRTKVENAIEKYTELYDKLYAAINDFLVAHGYEPIGFIKGYAPHFQTSEANGKLESALKAIGVDLGSGVGKLPTSIAGLTKSFKPNKRYNPFFQHRRGNETDYDIVKGFETYVDYASDVLYHTDDIMRVRQMANYLRSTFAPEEMKADIDQMEAMRYAPADVKEEYLRDKKKITGDTFLSYEDLTNLMEQYTDEKYRSIEDATEFSDLVSWMDDYANKLAGKQLFEDRAMEREVGREALNGAKKLNRMFARANVAGNLSSALNQTAQLPMIATELGQKYTWRAVGDILKGKTTGMSAFRGESDFLTEKIGIDYIQSTKGEKAIEKLFSPLEKVDTLVSTIAVRGKYRMELDAGKSPKEAMKAADRWARDIMGTRSKGSVPLTFQSKNLIAQMLNMFQVEAANTLEHVTQDRLGPGFKEMAAKIGKDKAKKKLASDVIAYMLLAFLLNRLDEDAYGGTPAPFDVLGMGLNAVASGNGLTSSDMLKMITDDVTENIFGERLFDTDPNDMNDEFDGWSAAEDTLYNISNDVPYVRNVAGLLGLGDETLPMPDLWGTATGIGKTLKKQATGKFDSQGDFWSEVGRQLMGLAGDTLPGGRQAEKTAQGFEALARGGSYQGTGGSKRLQYPVEPLLEDPFEALRAGLFGKNSLNESRAYWAAGGNALSVSQTTLYQELVDSGMSRKKAYETIRDFNDATADLEADKDENGNPVSGSKKEKVVEAINKLPLSRKQKDKLYLSKNYSEKDLDSLPWN